MPVELSPVDELDIDQARLDFAPEHYCANCSHFELHESESIQDPDRIPYCAYWDETTRVESGMVCREYLPQGYTE